MCDNVFRATKIAGITVINPSILKTHVNWKSVLDDLWYCKCEGVGSFFIAKSCLTHQWPSLFACDFVTPPIVCLCVQYTWDLLTFSSISSKACILNLLNGMRDSDEQSRSCVLLCRLWVSHLTWSTKKLSYCYPDMDWKAKIWKWFALF